MNNKEKKKFKFEHWHLITLCLVIYDTVAVSLAYFLSLLLRFDFKFSSIPTMYFKSWLYFNYVYVIVCIIVFTALKLYKSIWRFASFTEIKRILLATLITTIIHIVGSIITIRILTDLLVNRMPISYYIMGPILQLLLITTIRFSYRFILLLTTNKKKKAINRVLLVGAGEAGQMLIRDLKNENKAKDEIVCIIDDNENKWGREVDGIKVYGGRNSIIEVVKNFNIDKIYIAIPSISISERKKIIDICRQTDCQIMNLPGMYQLASGEVTVNALKKIDVEDLLGREQIEINSKEVRDYLTDKVVLITGGGGSIGSELCRQVALAKPKQLIIFDIYENNAHEIKLELEDKYPDLDLVVLIGSVRNYHRVKQVFSTYKPNIVFHAAAHKHVPLMEDSPCESIKNNVVGTYYTAYAAMANSCEKYVLISTDKAVNPVNIMGASKRLCEMIIQTFAKMIEEGRENELPNLSNIINENEEDVSNIVLKENSKTKFVAVRFGNVLGSNGSVIPRFRKQIENGGPVTVTHPEIIRYFMTIPEASSLVLTAATFGGDGKIFVLDMGTPVKIDDLARSMIKLSGLKPDVDIPVVYTGLRPGEKLYEERLMDEEGMEKTPNSLISIGKPIPFDEVDFLKELQELVIAAYLDRRDIKDIVSKVVNTYHPNINDN